MPSESAEFDEFWELATRSGLMNVHQSSASPDSFLEVTTEDIASVLQSVNEMASWIAHYLMTSISANRSQIPPALYSLLAVAQSVSREIVSQLAPCNCETCRPKPEM